MPLQVGPWCVPLPEGTRICHLRTNMGTDWAENVIPVLPDLAKPTDIVVRHAKNSYQGSHLMLCGDALWVM